MTKTSLRIFFIFVLLLFSCNGNEKRQGNGAESENDTANVISDDENTSLNFTKDEHNNLIKRLI